MTNEEKNGMRHLDRRSVLKLAAIGAMPFGSGTVWAQTAYPSRPVRMIVPLNPGGGTDVFARIVAEKLGTSLGQAIVVDNKPGASGMIGTDYVAKAAPDGYVVGITQSGPMLTNQFLFEKMSYDPQRDLTCVYLMALGPQILLVNPAKVPARNATELVEFIKREKGKLSYGSVGVGSYGHLALEYMSQTHDAKMAHAPYSGEAAMARDLIAGDVALAFGSSVLAKPNVDAGKLRAIGVSGNQRMSSLPNVPTLSEQGLTDEVFRTVGWLALVVPSRTPAHIVDRLHDEMRKIALLPDVQERIGNLGLEIVKDSTPASYKTFYEAQKPVWERLVKLAGVRPN